MSPSTIKVLLHLLTLDLDMLALVCRQFYMVLPTPTLSSDIALTCLFLCEMLFSSLRSENVPPVGMRNDFRGFGIILDIYDNDGKRDNPNIFVVANEDKDQIPNWNHDRDFASDMLRTTFGLV